MGAHLIDGEFQSDKYPTCPRGKVPLSCKDPTAQDLLWEYAQRRRPVDAEFSADLEEALRLAGYDPAAPLKGHDAGARMKTYLATTVHTLDQLELFAAILLDTAKAAAAKAARDARHRIQEDSAE
jgi:hypothetical protein